MKVSVGVMVGASVSIVVWLVEAVAVVAVVAEAVVAAAELLVAVAVVMSSLSSSLSTVSVPANDDGLFGSTDRISLLITSRREGGWYERACRCDIRGCVGML